MTKSHTFLKIIILSIYIYLLSFSSVVFSQEFLFSQVTVSNQYASYGIGFSSNFKFKNAQPFDLGESLRFSFIRNGRKDISFIYPISGVPSIVNQSMEILVFDFDYEIYVEKEIWNFSFQSGIAPKLRYFRYKTLRSSYTRLYRNGNELLFGISPFANILFHINENISFGIGLAQRFMFDEQDFLDYLYPAETISQFSLRLQI